MSQQLDEWKKAKSELDAAREAVLQLAKTFEAMADELRAVEKIAPGDGTVMMTPACSNWPKGDDIIKAVQGFNNAHLAELNAFNQLKPDERSIAPMKR